MKKRILMILLAVAVLGLVLLLPLPQSIHTADGSEVVLTRQGQAALAALCMTLVLWMTEAFPFAVTGLIGMTVAVALKAADFKTTVSDGFGNEIVVFCLGVMIFSAAVNRTHLLRRCIAFFLARFGGSPRMILLAFLTVGALASMWISNMAVAAMFTPLGVALLRGANLKPRASNFGRALMIACAWGPVIGGIGTPAGCGPNPLTIGFLHDLAGIRLGFFQWMLLGVPAMLLMIPCAWLTLLKCFPLESLDLRAAEATAHEGVPPRLAAKEKITLAVLTVTVALWIGEPFIARLTRGAVDFLSISFVALACSLLMYLPTIDLLTWKETEREVDWGSILLVVSGLSLGGVVYRTGAAAWVSVAAFSRLGGMHPLAQVFLVVLGMGLARVLFSSNTLTGVIAVPLMIALAKQIHADAALLAVPAGITASLAFILVTSAPTNVIPYAPGYFSVWDMAKAGLWMTLWSSLCVTLSFLVFGAACGIRVLPG